LNKKFHPFFSPSPLVACPAVAWGEGWGEGECGRQARPPKRRRGIIFKIRKR